MSKPLPMAASPTTVSMEKANDKSTLSNNLEKQFSIDKGDQLQHHGSQKFRRLSWVRLTICLIVEAIALGTLSIPSAFATLGMIPGVILTVGIGLITIYTSHNIGEVFLRHPTVEHYADAVRLIWGRWGYELCGVQFVVFLVVLLGSHTLTGTIAFVRIVDHPSICALIWGVVSAIILFLLALPPTFHDVSWLGYIDFLSILTAVLITVVTAGIAASHSPSGGLATIPWSLWPHPDTSFPQAFLALTNIVFAYSYAICQFSFMQEMHTPTDYSKALWTLGLVEIGIYTLTGALLYAFVGDGVRSPALLFVTAGNQTPIVSRIAFGLALPVIFISGAINGTVVARYLVNRAFARSPIRYTSSPAGWAVWISALAGLTLVAWVIAEAIPFFNALLGILSAVGSSGFTFYFPALFWFRLIKVGKWCASGKNLLLSVVNASVMVVGAAVLVGGVYASVSDIVAQYRLGEVGGAFTCASRAYS